jgi:hypothetical protein
VYDAADRRRARRHAIEDLMTDPTNTAGAEPAPPSRGTVAGVSETAAGVAESSAESAEHAADPAGGHHGTGDDAAKPLGPADWGAWAGGILGVTAGLLVAACLWLSTSGL